MNRALAAALFFAAGGCALIGEEPDRCDSEPIDPFRELLVVDDAVLRPDDAVLRPDDAVLRPDDATANARPWAPAALLRATGSGAWLARGLTRWHDAAQSDGHGATASALDALVLCRWLRATPANECDATCAACAHREFVEEAAPFRTLAVVNRTDLGILPDARSRAGEGRVVLGLAPTSDGEAPPLGMTLIFEYALSGSRADWARRWHALCTLDGPTASRDLGRIVEGFVSAVEPDGKPALSQLRASIDAGPDGAELRELAPDATGELVPHGLRNTPRADLDGSAALDSFVRADAAQIREGTQVLPSDMLALAQPYGAHDWSLPDIDSDTRLEFDRGTCAGCHAHDDTDGGFQISPWIMGRAGVSRFLNAPSAPDDELRRREREERLALCPQADVGMQ